MAQFPKPPPPKQTGNHQARRMAAKAEPSPVTALRDMLATAFASDVAAVTPEICEILRAGISAEASPAKRDVLRHALVVLARQTGSLSLAIIGEVRDRFDAKIAPGPNPFASTSSLSLDQLTLMDDMALKTDLALNQCSARLREQTSAEIFQLTARVCEMLGRESLGDDENPILPRLFARSLLGALGKLGFEGEARLALFKSYGPALLHIAPDLYLHANTLLEELGVLCGFTAKYGRPVVRPATPARRPTQPLTVDPATLASILDRLLSGQRVAHPL
jgi:Protein of unknown function (DUF1631)